MSHRPGRSWLAALAALAALLGGCDPLDVQNPQVITEEDLQDTVMVRFMVNGIITDFQFALNRDAFYSGAFSDELVNGHVFAPHRPFDRRDLSGDQRISDGGIYGPMHRARGTADTLTARIRNVLGAGASASLAVARGLAFAGYTYVIMGEQFCETPINAGPALTPQELLTIAVARFDEAIQVAQAAKAADPDDAAAADSLINLARVGAARASLQLGDDAGAIQYASQVPPGFEFWIFHSDNSGLEENFFWGATAGPSSSRWIGLDPSFEGLNDPRIPHSATALPIMDSRTFFIPMQPYNFSEWNGTTGVPFGQSTHMRFALGLEARYIVAEAGTNNGTMTAVALRAFIDERRTVGGQGAFPGTDAELFAELLDQRRRDFYLTGHRLGDIRRYKARYGLDFFPTGPYPQSTTGEVYGTWECFPISVSERNSNPNL